MDVKYDFIDSYCSDILSECQLYLLSGRLDALVILTPEEWAFSFKLIEKRVSFLLKSSDTSVFSELCNLVITLSYPKTLKSLVDYCLGSQIDERSRRTLSGLFILFSRAAIELNESHTNSLSSNLISISKDLTLIQKNHDSDKHPINILANKLSNYFDSLPEDY